MSDELFHYGVKGMKWGKRQSSSSKKKLADGYSEKQYRDDATYKGKRTANRINKRVEKGASVKEARKSQARRDTQIQAAVVVGSTVAALFGPQILMASAKGVAKTIPVADSVLRGAERAYEREGMRRGMQKATNLLADTRGLTSYQTISLAQDAVTGKWG